MASSVELSVIRGEDYAAQIFWTDPWGEPVAVTDPVEATARDSAGQTAIKFVPSADPTVEAAVVYNTAGFFQLTMPAQRTWSLVPGTYGFDLWAGVMESAPPFQAQRQQVLSGVLTVRSPVTAYVKA